MDGDGYPDVVASYFYLDSVKWFKNVDGLGGFSAEYDVTADDVNGAKWVEVADIDGDGDLDVIAASSIGGMCFSLAIHPREGIVC